MGGIAFFGALSIPFTLWGGAAFTGGAAAALLP